MIETETAKCLCVSLKDLKAHLPFKINLIIFIIYSLSFKHKYLKIFSKVF